VNEYNNSSEYDLGVLFSVAGAIFYEVTLAGMIATVVSQSHADAGRGTDQVSLYCKWRCKAD